jgi:putative ATP-dependent endonuclease of OLD family
MAILVSITLANYRSIQGPLQIKFPRSCPVILLGENNAGKSNIVKGVNLLLGNFWPGSHDPKDHEFYDRDRTRTIRLTAEFSTTDRLGGRYTKRHWMYDPTQKEPFFRGYPGRYGNFDGFISGDDRDTCVCVVLEAERNLGYQLSYSSKFTLLSRLMHKFHKALAGRAQTKAELETLFGQIKKKVGEIPEFAEFTTSLRRQLGDLISTMTHRLEVDFEAYNPVNFFHALRLHGNNGTSPCTLEEMSTGETQILAISFAHAFAKAFHGGIVLVI